MDSIGQTLRDARHAEDVTLTYVARRTRIRETFLDALERDDFETLPIAAVYVRSALRTYAQYLELDAEAIVAAYDRRNEPDAEPSSRRRWARPAVGRFAALALLVAVVGVGAVAVAATTGVSPRSELAGQALAPGAASPTVAPTSSAPRPTPTVAPIPTPTPAPAAPVDSTDTTVVLATPHDDARMSVRLVFRGASWARVVVDGVDVFEDVQEAGTTQRYDVTDRIEVRVGSADAVGFVVDGRRLGAVADTGSGVNTVVCSAAARACAVANP